MVVHDILSEGLKAEGGFGYLELPKSKSEAAVTNLFYARTVPGWGWILVATVPLDRMTEVVFQHKDSLRATMVRQIGLILGSLAVAALAGGRGRSVSAGEGFQTVEVEASLNKKTYGKSKHRIQTLGRIHTSLLRIFTPSRGGY
jgi:hypothetical protein